jgi:hypothetical protein
MRTAAVILCAVGVLLIAAGSIPLSGDYEAMDVADWAKGIAGVLIGLAMGVIGLVLHLADYILRVSRDRDSLGALVRVRLLGLEVTYAAGTYAPEDPWSDKADSPE